MNQEMNDTIGALALEIIQKLGFRGSVSVGEDRLNPDVTLVSLIVEEDQHYLIGQRGANLAAFQHLFRALLKKKQIDTQGIEIDINHYIDERREQLLKEVDKSVSEALSERVSVSLRPMPAFERKIIHTYLAKRSDVETESAGEGPDRHIFIRPKISPEDVS